MSLDLHACPVGGWLQLPGSATAELMGSVGFDFVCVDQQHGLIGDDALLPMLQGLAATGTPALVRVTSNEPAAIGRALDRGADGVIVPLVNSADETARAVDACRYPPRGHRSYGPTRVGWRAAATDSPASDPRAADPLCIVMVETLDALDALPAILATAGVDAVFIGPSDLALSAGMRPDTPLDDPAFDALLRSVIDPVRAAGLPVGSYCASPAHVHGYRELGATFAALMAEAAMLRAAAATHLAASRRV